MSSTDIEIDDAQSAALPLSGGAEAVAAPPARPDVVSGSVWTVAGFGIMQILRLGSNVVLTRLLFPQFSFYIVFNYRKWATRSFLER